MTPSTLRRWRRNPLRRRSALSPCLAAWDALRARDKWHLDKVSITINGEQKYLWRAVDQYGNLLDILVQNRRNKASGQALLPSAPPRIGEVAKVIGTHQAALRSFQIGGGTAGLTDRRAVLERVGQRHLSSPGLDLVGDAQPQRGTFRRRALGPWTGAERPVDGRERGIVESRRMT
ncbi:hypothetical protein GCM10009646_13590 [Streptomyces aureus]